VVAHPEMKISNTTQIISRNLPRSKSLIQNSLMGFVPTHEDEIIVFSTKQSFEMNLR